MSSSTPDRNRYGPDPDEVFTKAQWAAIAQSIARDQIPPEEKQEICDALFNHAIAKLAPKALKRFVDEARKFGVAASRVQNFLRKLRVHDKIETLIEDVYQVQRLIDDEFKRRPNPKGGRPRSQALDDLVDHLGTVFTRLTGKDPGVTVDPLTGKLSGLTYRFLTNIFRPHDISTAGLRRPIERAKHNAENRAQIKST
jgi:hypothetical protein